MTVLIGIADKPTSYGSRVYRRRQLVELHADPGIPEIRILFSLDADRDGHFLDGVPVGCCEDLRALYQRSIWILDRLLLKEMLRREIRAELGELEQKEVYDTAAQLRILRERAGLFEDIGPAEMRRIRYGAKMSSTCQISEQKRKQRGILTARQVELLGLLDKGYSREAAAEQMGCCVATTGTHLRGARLRTGICEVPELINYAKQRGYIPEGVQYGKDE